MDLQGDLKLHSAARWELDEFAELMGLHAIGPTVIFDRSIRSGPTGNRGEPVECARRNRPFIEHDGRARVSPKNPIGRNGACRFANILAGREIKIVAADTRSGMA